MKPNLRFPEFSGEWEQKRLGEVGEAIIGLTYSPKDVDDNGVIVLRSSNIKDNLLDLSDIVRVNKKIPEKLKIKKNDIVICVRNGSQSLIGKSIIIKEPNNMTFGAFMSVFRSKINEFIYYLFQTQKYKKQILQNLGARINQITNKQLLNFKFYFPPTIKEQEKIAEFLSSVDEKIELTTKKIEKLKEYKKGLLQKLLNVKDGVPELRFPEFSGEWVEKRLGEIGDTYSGLTNKNKEHFNKGNDYYIPFLNIMNNIIIDNSFLEKIVISQNENQNQVKKGDILFTTSSETPQEVGMCSVYLDNKKVYLNSFCFGYRLKSINIDSLFLTYFLRYRRDIFYKIAQGATRYNLSKKYFNKIKIHIPPTLEEQQKIAEFLSSIDDKIELNEKKLSKLKEYKKGLLQKMFV